MKINKKTFQQIFEALTNHLFHSNDPQINKISKERLKICADCLYNSKNKQDKQKRIFLQRIFIKRPDAYCMLCHCNLKLKSKCLHCECDLLKWRKEK